MTPYRRAPRRHYRALGVRRDRSPTPAAAPLQGYRAAQPRGTGGREHLRLAVAARWLATRDAPQARGGYLGRVVDLAAGTERWYQLGAAKMDGATETIQDDVERQRAFFAAGDPGRPLPMEAWPKTTDDRTCVSCCFRMLCDQGVATAHRAG